MLEAEVLNNHTNVLEEKYFQEPEVVFLEDLCQNQMSSKPLVY